MCKNQHPHAPKYGLVVTGFIDPRRIICKRGARPGDALILTKPLGIGVITTGIILCAPQTSGLD